MNQNFEELSINSLDNKIWKEELSEFVPEKIFDIHTHIYRWLLI